MVAGYKYAKVEVIYFWVRFGHVGSGITFEHTPLLHSCLFNCDTNKCYTNLNFIIYSCSSSSFFLTFNSLFLVPLLPHCAAPQLPFIVIEAAAARGAQLLIKLCQWPQFDNRACIAIAIAAPFSPLSLLFLLSLVSLLSLLSLSLLFLPLTTAHSLCALPTRLLCVQPQVKGVEGGGREEGKQWEKVLGQQQPLHAPLTCHAATAVAYLIFSSFCLGFKNQTTTTTKTTVADPVAGRVW